MKQLGIRWRLTLWYGAILTAMFIVFSSAVFLMMRQHLLARTDAELDEELNELALEVRLAKGEQELQDQLRHRFSHHDSFDFQVSVPDGKPIFRSEKLRDTVLPIPAVLADARHLPSNEVVHATQTIGNLGKFRVASQLADTPSAKLIVQVIASTEPYAKEMQAVILMLAAVGPLCIVAAVLGGYVLARQALDPVTRMTATAELISAEHLHKRLEIRNADDELGRLALTLNRMIDRLHASLQEMQRFTADAAHELRTPLAVLRTECEVALRSARSAESYRGTLEVTLAETDRMARLADQLLLLCRQDAGLQTVGRDEVRLDAVLQDVADQMRGIATQKGLTLEVAALSPWIVAGDDVRLSQVFFNLLENAIKYSPAGGSVCISAESRNGRIQVAIADTGIGIPAEHLPHIFKRFYRVDSARSRDRGGTGLGLAICQAIVEAHAGTIHVESVVGSRTRFVVDLPESSTTADAVPHGSRTITETEVGTA